MNVRGLVLSWLVLAGVACAQASPRRPAEGDELESRWSDDLAPGHFDTCRYLRSGVKLPERSTKRIACEDEAFCRARTVELQTRGKGFDPSWVVAMLEGSGLHVQEHGEVRLEVDLEVETSTTSWMPTCNSRAGCPEPHLQVQTHTTTRGELRAYDDVGRRIWR